MSTRLDTEVIVTRSQSTRSDSDGVVGFAGRLARLRKTAGLSQTELAGDDLSASYVSLLESGKRQPSEAVVRTLATRLGCSTSLLSEGEHSERERRLSLELSYARLALTHGEHTAPGIV